MLKLTRMSVSVAKNLTKYNSTKPASKVIENLSQRGLLRISGTDTSSFLQGLITNDMRHLDDGGASMYTMFLNTKGRVMYDAILYRTSEDGVFYIECDARASQALQKHLKLYRVRRKIDVDDLTGELKVWAFFDPSKTEAETTYVTDTKKMRLAGQIFPCNSLNNDSVQTTCSKVVEDVNIYPDPRLSRLGFRIITHSGTTLEDVVARVDPDTVESGHGLSYKSFLYKLGIGEGCDDLLPGKALPLESNCDYLHGVSFHKGCYIGQELTARTHHTGVVRKRLMPVTLDAVPSEPLQYDQAITDDTGKAIGKLKGYEKMDGLGLVRIAETLTAKTLRISAVNGRARRPFWWPQETPKERASVAKND